MRSGFSCNWLDLDQLVHAGVDEDGQRHRPEDRNAVFEIAHALRIAAR